LAIDMKNLLKVALIRAEETEEEQILALLKPHNYEIEHVHDAGDIVELIESEKKQFDAIAVPFKTLSGKSGLSACIFIKAEEALSATPVIPFFFHNDKAVIESLYGAGADYVVVPPIDSELLLFQLKALRRQRVFFRSQLNKISNQVVERQDFEQNNIRHTELHKEAQKSRSMALLAASSLYAKTNRLPSLAETSIESTTIDSPSLSQTLMKVLELADLLVNPDIAIKVDLKADWNLKLNTEDLFCLLGHLILFACDSARSGGSVSIGAEVDTRKKIILQIHSLTLANEDDENQILNQELDNLVENLTPPVQKEGKVKQEISSGLAAAIRLARKYGSKLEYRIPTSREVKLRLQLPLSVEIKPDVK